MSAVSETYNCSHKILGLGDILRSISFTTSEIESDYY